MALPDQHPEICRLKVACDRHRMDLHHSLSEWYRLTVEVRPKLLALYDEAFGDLERTRQQLALESSELFRRIELLSIKLQRGEKLTPEIIAFVNSVVDSEYARLRSKMQYRSTEQQPSNTMQPNGYAEVAQMYRVLAKQYHPDVANGSPDINQWHQVQDAYVKKDTQRLQALCAALGATDVPAATEGWTLERWEEEEQRLGIRSRIEQRKLHRLQNEEPFTSAANLEDTVWVTKHRAELEKEIDVRRKEFAEQRRIYKDITNGSCTPYVNPAVSQQQAAFNQEFIENTYFNNR